MYFWCSNAEGTLQYQASHLQNYKINNGVRVPSAKTFLSPPTCIFLTAEEDGGLLLIVPRLTPPGPGGMALSCVPFLCGWACVFGNSCHSKLTEAHMLTIRV